MKHVVIGAGPAGVVAAETLVKLDPSANVVLIGDEPEPPYSRMAIPYFLEGNIEENGSYLRKTDGYYQTKGIELIRQRVAKLDADAKQLSLENGDQVAFDRLLIATGSSPMIPPITGIDGEKVANCWTLEDARQIVANVKPGARVVQIGAGFIGCIILESLVKRGASLTVVEMGDRMVPRMLDQECGTMLKSWCEEKGVTVLTSTVVKAIEDNGSALNISLSSGDSIEADFVISATGVRTNAELAKEAGIKVEDGILVDQYLQTSAEGIYAAGDVAQGIDFSTGEYSVQAIQPTATEHGLVSAKNMITGNQAEYGGAVLMNVLATLDLISVSYGLWEGVEGGDTAVLSDPDNYRYIRLQFDGNVLVGANTLGITQNIGSLRGLIQTRRNLGIWKARLMDNPLEFMDAYVAISGNHS